MAPDGLAPDQLADLVGFDYVEEWAVAFSQACQVARDRTVSDDWDDDVAADDDAELIGPDELAGLLDVSRSAVRQWRHRGLLPTPDLTLSGVPIWTLRTVRDWAALTGRTIDRSAA